MVSFKVEVDEVTALEDTKIIKTLLKELETTDFLCSVLSVYFFVCSSEFHAGDGNSKPFLGQLFYVENCLRRRGRRWKRRRWERSGGKEEEEVLVVILPVIILKL